LSRPPKPSYLASPFSWIPCWQKVFELRSRLFRPTLHKIDPPSFWPFPYPCRPRRVSYAIPRRVLVIACPTARFGSLTLLLLDYTRRERAFFFFYCRRSRVIFFSICRFPTSHRNPDLALSLCHNSLFPPSTASPLGTSPRRPVL